MDFKGITWAGNIYQKFEAMCLEVEEVMYEDTVKYVENQVQKVGVTVKKFYSEVMQDMLPPSCMEPVKVAAGDLSLNPYGDTDVNKKPKSSILASHGELKKKETEDEDISDLIAEKSPIKALNDRSHLSPPSNRVLVENTRSEACSTRSKKVGAYKRSIGIRRISQNNHPPKMSRPTTSLSGDRSSIRVCDTSSGCMVASDGMNVTTSPEFSVRLDPEAALNKNAPVFVASVESHPPYENLPAETVMQEKDSKCTSTASDKIISAESLMQKKDDGECTSSSHGLPTESIATTMKEMPFSQSVSSSRSGDMNVTTSPEFSVRRDPEAALNKNAPVSVASVESYPPYENLPAETVMQEKDNSKCTSPASDKIISAESLMQKKDDGECTSSSHGLPTESIATTMKEIPFSQSVSSSRSDAREVESVGMDVKTSDEDKFRKDGPFSQINSNISSDTYVVELADEGVIVSREDNFGIDPIENEEDDDLREEIFKPAEKSKLEETCIWVEGDELHFVPQGLKKHKSYKKKFREALSLRLTRKQDQPVSQYKDLGRKNDQEVVIPTLTIDSNKQKLPAYDDLESDWELL